MLHAILGRLRAALQKGSPRRSLRTHFLRLLQAHNVTVRGTIDVYRYMGGVAAWQVGALGAVLCAVPRRLVLQRREVGVCSICQHVHRRHSWLTDWQDEFPRGGCLPNGTWPHGTCSWWCDAQSCDQAHPNHEGNAVVARTVKNGWLGPE